MRRSGYLFIFLALSFVLSGVTYAQPSAAQAAAERYARELAGYVTTGDRVAYRKFVQENFGGEIANMPMDAHLGFMSSIHDRTRGTCQAVDEEVDEQPGSGNDRCPCGARDA